MKRVGSHHVLGRKHSHVSHDSSNYTMAHVHVGVTLNLSLIYNSLLIEHYHQLE